MRVSLNTVKQYTEINVSIGELVEKINRQLGGVEEVLDFSQRYQGAVIVKVVACDKHPNADKLNVCEVDDGSGELTKVVCGAPNVRTGMFAIWLKPGAVVPATATDKEPFVLGARELRGVMSNGMLASPKELGFGDNHEGILEVDSNEWKPSDVKIKPGTLFAEAYGLNDTVIDIENKMFTHRPDLFGQLGVAREIAGIQHHSFKSPDWYVADSTAPPNIAKKPLELTVFNEATADVPRFMAVALSGVTVKPSPLWLQSELVRLGSKPINNIVDATNYIMLLTAQPTHAYDYDTLAGNTIGTRYRRPGDKYTLLNRHTYVTPLNADMGQSKDVVIVDGDGVIGLGGVMGGADSEVSSTTKNIVLEVATFNMYTVRKTSMQTGLFTDAVTRFNKGQSPLQNDVVLARLINLIIDIAGGEVASEIHDLHGDLESDRLAFVSPTFINDRLGFDLTKQEIEKLLQNVEFEICDHCDDPGHASNSVHYGTPFWRTDIELPEDIVEEVGRLYGYERLPKQLPERTIAPTKMNATSTAKSKARHLLRSFGANEIVTYSFVHEKILERAGQDKANAYRLSNALSPDLQYYRVGLIPSLLDKVHMNIKAGHDHFALFEINKVHYKNVMDKNEPDVPREDMHLALVIAYSNKTAPGGAAYFHAKMYLEKVVTLKEYDLQLLADYDVPNDDQSTQLVSAYEPRHSAVITKDNKIVGIVGEFKQEVRNAFKLPTFAAGFEIDLDIVSTATKQYRPLSKYPSISQDLSLSIEADATYDELSDVATEVLTTLDQKLHTSLEPISIYQAEDSGRKTITLRLIVTSYESTLTDKQASEIVQLIASAANERLNAKLV